MTPVTDTRPDIEAEQRRTPKEGEVWFFCNGAIGVIYEVTDKQYGYPEIAFTTPGDTTTLFKFNGTTDPMPVRKLAEGPKPQSHIQSQHRPKGATP